MFSVPQRCSQTVPLILLCFSVGGVGYFGGVISLGVISSTSLLSFFFPRFFGRGLGFSA